MAQRPPTAETTRQLALQTLHHHAEGLWRTLCPDRGPYTRLQIQLTRHYVSYTTAPPQITLNGVMRWAYPDPAGEGWLCVVEAPVQVSPDRLPLLCPPSITPDRPDPWGGMRESTVRERLGLFLDAPVGSAAHLRLAEPLDLALRPDGGAREALLCLRLWWSLGRTRRGRVFLWVRLHPDGQLAAFRLCGGRAARDANFEAVDRQLLPDRTPQHPEPLRLSDASAILSGTSGGPVGLRPLERGLVTLNSDGDLMAYVAEERGDWRRVVRLIPQAHLADGPRACAYLRAWATAFGQAIVPDRHLSTEGFQLSGSARLLDRPALRTEDDFHAALLREIFFSSSDSADFTPQSGGS